MKSRLSSVVILVTISLFLFLNIQAQSNNMISGHIFNKDRLPQADVYVELLNEMNGIIGRMRTNSGGLYLFRGLSAGTFTIRVLTYGTDLEEQSVEVVITTSGIAGRAPSESIQQDIYLRQRKPPKDGKELTGTVFVQDIPQESRNQYDAALKAFADGNQEDGIQKLENAVKVFPTYFYALERLGQEYSAQEKWESSYNNFKKAVEINPKSFTSCYGLSVSASKLQKFDEALNAANNAVKNSPSSPEGLLLLGNSQRKMKQFAEAEKSFLDADKLSKGKLPDVHWNLALLYAYNLLKYSAAADRLELYLKNKPDAPAESIKKLIQQFREKATSSN